MAKIYGLEMTKPEILRRLGNASQLAYIRPSALGVGQCVGLKVFDVSNGVLDFTVLEGRALDIYNMKFKGMNLNFVYKSGLSSQFLSAPVGDEAFRGFCGGMLYTCGMSNVGPACVYEGRDQVFHGQLRGTAAENISTCCAWRGDEYDLKIQGEMREAQIFKENLLFKREISTSLGEKRLFLKNAIENAGFAPQEIMLMFHINIGFPLLDKGAKLVASFESVKPRDEASKAGLDTFDRISDPIDKCTEQVFYLKPRTDNEGNTMAAIVNSRLNLGFYVKYNTATLPELIFWKSMVSGDYVVGVEPSNCFPEGKVRQKQIGRLQSIEPLDILHFDIELGILEGDEEIGSFCEEVSNLK